MNITLIGMPGSGKSGLGKILAKKLGYRFIDIDELIEKEESTKLQNILDKLGDKAFIKLEEKTIISLGKLDNCIISPGGSVVYSKKAMNHLKKISKVVFLDASLKVILRWIDNLDSRGIVGLKNKSMKELFNERQKLYKKYADVTINASKTFNVESIMKKL